MHTNSFKFVRDFAASEITVSIWLTPHRNEARPGFRNTSSKTGSKKTRFLGSSALAQRIHRVP
jgi:hypothetical protein